MSLNSEEFEDDSSLEDDEDVSYNKWNSLVLCVDELEVDWEDEEECDISFDFNELEDDNSLGSDDGSFYSGDHIGGIGFVESDNNNNDDWSTVLSALTGASSKNSTPSVSARYHDNISGNESESSETLWAARAMTPDQRDATAKSEWDEAWAKK